MELICKIAGRNLWRHRGHSLVIGAILFLGSLFMTVGNGVVSGMDRGLQRTIVRSFTGDIVLLSDKHESDNVFMEMMGRAVEPIEDYAAVRAVLEKDSALSDFLPIGKNMAMILNDEDGPSAFVYLLGVDFGRYRKMFPGNMEILEGRFPVEGQTGMLLPLWARKEIRDQTNVWFVPAGAPMGLGLDTSHMDADARKHRADMRVKNGMVMMGFNEANTATDIRLNVDGVFRYNALNTIFGHFALTDIESYRKCLGYFLASEKNQGKVSGADSALLSMEDGNLDAMFGTDSLVVTDKPAAGLSGPPVRKSPPREAVSPRPQNPPAGASVKPAAMDLDQGAYNLVLLLLKNGVNSDAALAELNARLKQAHASVRAVPWKKALGVVGSMATIIKGALFVFVSLLFVVAVIVIVNTLTMAALERTPELGMMRAIGARKGFIGGMFLAETAMLSALFGGLGIVAGILGVGVLSLLKLTSENDMLQLFFGGDTFHPLLTAGDIVLAGLQLAFVTVAAVTYPLLLARKVGPLDAIGKE